MSNNTAGETPTWLIPKCLQIGRCSRSITYFQLFVVWICVLRVPPPTSPFAQRHTIGQPWVLKNRCTGDAKSIEMRGHNRMLTRRCFPTPSFAPLLKTDSRAPFSLSPFLFHSLKRFSTSVSLILPLHRFPHQLFLSSPLLSCSHACSFQYVTSFKIWQMCNEIPTSINPFPSADVAKKNKGRKGRVVGGAYWHRGRGYRKTCPESCL